MYENKGRGLSRAVKVKLTPCTGRKDIGSAGTSPLLQRSQVLPKPWKWETLTECKGWKLKGPNWPQGLGCCLSLAVQPGRTAFCSPALASSTVKWDSHFSCQGSCEQAGHTPAGGVPMSHLPSQQEPHHPTQHLQSESLPLPTPSLK